jgi:hypothetical protein
MSERLFVGKFKTPEEGIARVEKFLAKGDVQSAFDQSLILLGDEETHAEMLLKVCFIFTTAGKYDEALKFADRMARLAPDLPQARSINASCLFRAGYVDEAFEEALEALALDPENVEALRVAFTSSFQLPDAASLEMHAATLLREGDRLQDAALVLRYLAHRSQGAPFGAIFSYDGLLYGFALSLAQPEAHFEMELSLGSFKLTALAADQPHQILALAGLPDGHAFVHQVPAELMNVQLSAKLLAGHECIGSPVRPSDWLPIVRGTVLAKDCNVIEGHVWRPSAPGKRLCVVLEGESGQKMDLVASQYHDELVTLGVHDGKHAFSVKWPLPDGVVCERVYVRELKTGQRIQGSPVLVYDAGLAVNSLKAVNSWLLAVGNQPDSPPPLPESCRGQFLRLFRMRQGEWMHALSDQAVIKPVEVASND